MLGEGKVVSWSVTVVGSLGQIAPVRGLGHICVVPRASSGM